MSSGELAPLAAVLFGLCLTYMTGLNLILYMTSFIIIM